MRECLLLITPLCLSEYWMIYRNEKRGDRRVCRRLGEAYRYGVNTVIDNHRKMKNHRIKELANIPPFSYSNNIFAVVFKS